ncbi:MAG: DUF721 domain-containing protein [Candidatus Omnitrophica bacterium]|nr:DUF721 domain-containing protein [Candidatus Omnitrophota bacterium]MBU1933269.1 DUF721 domain-containing protein [Candidatus Omnitrophota bacterium]
MTRRKHTKRPEDIKGIIDKVINRLEKRGPGKKEKILAVWQKVAGSKAASHSRPIGIKRRILTVEADSSTWIYSLSLKKREMLKNLQWELKEEGIKDIRFRMGDIT